MSGHLFPFLVDKDRKVYILVGDVDPTASPGIAFDSSLYLKVDAGTKSVAIYARTGANATDWTLFGGTPSTLPAGVTVQVQDALNQEGGEIVLKSANGHDDWHFDVKGDDLRWFTDGIVKLDLNRNGNLTATGVIQGSDVQGTSDRRLKAGFRPLTGALARVRKLKPFWYWWRADPTRELQAGLGAQDVGRVMPWARARARDRRRTQSIKLPALVAELAAALQELDAQVQAQAQELARLQRSAAR